MFKLMDNAPLTELELAEQCLALLSAIIKLEEVSVKEPLQFILHEKTAALFTTLSSSNG